jgi:hypothetical protein
MSISFTLSQNINAYMTHVQIYPQIFTPYEFPSLSFSKLSFSKLRQIQQYQTTLFGKWLKLLTKIIKIPPSAIQSKHIIT